jgi:hypothetical protein
MTILMAAASSYELVLEAEESINLSFRRIIRYGSLNINAKSLVLSLNESSSVEQPAALIPLEELVSSFRRRRLINIARQLVPFLAKESTDEIARKLVSHKFNIHRRWVDAPFLVMMEMIRSLNLKMEALSQIEIEVEKPPYRRESEGLLLPQERQKMERKAKGIQNAIGDSLQGILEIFALWKREGRFTPEESAVLLQKFESSLERIGSNMNPSSLGDLRFKGGYEVHGYGGSVEVPSYKFIPVESFPPLNGEQFSQCRRRLQELR